MRSGRHYTYFSKVNILCLLLDLQNCILWASCWVVCYRWRRVLKRNSQLYFQHVVHFKYMIVLSACFSPAFVTRNFRRPSPQWSLIKVNKKHHCWHKPKSSCWGAKSIHPTLTAARTSSGLSNPASPPCQAQVVESPPTTTERRWMCGQGRNSECVIRRRQLVAAAFTARPPPEHWGYW